jgi:predicted dithiol-disulfide oxidoreductase (DUF899 family)
VADPYHHPRWWPRVARVEGVTARGWTYALVSSRGNTVRTDWVVEVNEQPTRRRWAQEIEGTPFERLFKRNAVEAQLDHAEAAGTRVTLSFDQQPRGLARMLPFIVKRPMGRQLDEALDNLAAAVE